MIFLGQINKNKKYLIIKLYQNYRSVLYYIFCDGIFPLKSSLISLSKFNWKNENVINVKLTR